MGRKLIQSLKRQQHFPGIRYGAAIYRDVGRIGDGVQCGQHFVAGNNFAGIDRTYFAQRAAMETPMGFISHDSRDKEPFVRELAAKLQSMLCKVRYDEFFLSQSLRASIEEGLKTCKKCILVLSPSFIENNGWTKAEFDSVFTREILEKKNVVIPIWHGVTKQQVYEYSPRLLDRVAISSSIGVEEVARKVLQGINYQA